MLDCDVIQADGGTRTAAISGAWVALRLAVDKLLGKALADDPIRTQVAAVSCGIHEGTPVLDLDYIEDSAAGSDGNFVLTDDGEIVEAQVTAEGATYDEEGLLRLLRLARIGCARDLRGAVEGGRPMRRDRRQAGHRHPQCGQAARDRARCSRRTASTASARPSSACPSRRRSATPSSTMPS